MCLEWQQAPPHLNTPTQTMALGSGVLVQEAERCRAEFAWLALCHCGATWS